MKIDLHSETRGTTTIAVVEIDPARTRGSRNSFGPLLHLGIQLVFDADKKYHQPILFEGQLSWPGEGSGTIIPLQSVGGGTADLLIPLNDHQVASMEHTRAGREPTFELSLRAIGMPDEPGKLGRYTANHIPQLQIPRDVWKRVLEGLGFGLVRIIELPAPDLTKDANWRRATDELAAASQHLSEARYGEAVVSARTAVERIVESVGAIIGVTRKGPRLAPYVDEVAAALRRINRGSDPFALIGELMKAAFAWASEPAHQGFRASKRDDAVFAINLSVALYSYLVCAEVAWPTVPPED